jgi:hypothetical protein
VVTGGQGQLAPLVRRQELAGLLVALEPEHGAAQHPGGVQVGAHPRLDRAQVLAHDEGAGADRLEREHAEQRVAVVGHVGARARAGVLRHPPQPEQAHHVVDPQPAGVPQAAAHHVAERRVAQLGQPVRPPGRQPPVLALLVEGVRRRPDGGAQRERVLQRPGVGAAGVHSYGQVVDDADGHAAAEPGELLVDEQLHPAPEGDPVGVLLRGGCHGRRVRAAQLLRPGLPRGAVLLGQRAEQRELLRAASPCSPGTQPGPARGAGGHSSSAPPAARSRRGRAGPLGVGDGAQRNDRVPDLLRRRRVLGHVLDPQVDGERKRRLDGE